MSLWIRFAAGVNLVCALCLPINAQSPQEKQANEKKSTIAEGTGSQRTKSGKNSNSELAIKRRAATSLLVTLASDARGFRDEALRARTLARVADALWDADAEQSRALFRRAWESAENADKEAMQRLRDDVAQQKAKTGGYAVASPTSLRREVLRLAARREQALGAEFIKKLEADKQREAQDAASSFKPDRFRSSDLMLQRLNLAQDLLDMGNTDLAIQFADPILSAITMQTLNFLSNLREKNANAADQRYAAVLAYAADDPQSDANTVSLLSSYVFSPHYFVVFRGVNSTSTSQWSSNITPPQIAPELRNAFFQSAALILSRPLPPPELDTSTAGVGGKYLVIKRLFPMFEQYAPRQLVESLRAQLESLTALVQEDVRDRDDESLRKGIQPEQRSADLEQSLLDRIDRVKTSAERDALYLQLALLTSGKGDMRARDFVDKIEDSELRQKVGAYIDPLLAMQAIDKKQSDRALQLVKIGNLTHLQKAWVLTAVAKLLSTSAPEKSLSLLDDGTLEAQRIEGKDPDRPRAMFAVSNALLKIDQAKVWDATFDAMKAANAADGYTGEDDTLTLKFQTKGSSSVKTIHVGDFDVEGIFGALASNNYDHAVELALTFQSPAPRASALIAIARAMLNAKEEPNKQEQRTGKN
jgi:hypothetical protein